MELLEKIDELEDLIIVPNVDKDPENSINALKILNLITKLRSLVEETQWISVKDKLPEDDDSLIIKPYHELHPFQSIKVLVITNRGSLTDSSRLKKMVGEKKWSWFGSYEDETITHWRQFEKPDKEYNLDKDPKVLRFIEKLKKDPLYETKQEFGRFMFRHIDELSPEELKRYNELKEILVKVENEKNLIMKK